MNSWIPKSKIVKLAVGVVILSLLFYLAGLFFVAKQTQKVEDFYVNMNSDSSEENKISAIKSIINTKGTSLQSLRDFFVKKGDEVKFIENIENIAKNNNLKFEISSINVKSDNDQTLSEDIEVKINVEGDWDNVVGMIDDLERLTFGVLINDVNLNANKGGYWSGSMKFIVFKEK